MDAMTNILLQRYRQQASLLTGLQQTTAPRNTGQIGGTALQQSQLSNGIQSLTGAQETTGGSLFSSSGGARASLSAIGNQLNQFAATIGDNSDAKAGLRAFTLELANNRYGTEGVSVMEGLRDLQQNDNDLFTSAFAAAGQVANAGGNATSFMKTLTSLNEPTQQTSLVRSVSEIMKTEGTNTERRQLTGSIMGTITDIQRSTAGDDEKKAIESFFSELDTYKTLEDQSQFVETFHRRNPFIFYT